MISTESDSDRILREAREFLAEHKAQNPPLTAANYAWRFVFILILALLSWVLVIGVSLTSVWVWDNLSDIQSRFGSLGILICGFILFSVVMQLKRRK
jgi:hypothetical protein